MGTRCHALIVLLAMTLLPAIGATQTASASGGAPDLRALLANKGDPVRGKALFAPCEDCHRKDASGRRNGVFPRLSGQHATVIVKQLHDIRSGRRNNVAMEPLLADPGLDSGAIADIAAYLQALPIGAGNGRGAGTDLARGRQLYERDCDACHGARGEGVADAFHPMVAAQHYQYLLRELIAIRDGERRNSNPAMASLIKPYSPADMEAVSDYLSRLAPPAR